MFLPGEFEKLLEIIRMAQPRIMVEIGCHEGRTAAICLREISSLQKYVGIEIEYGHQLGLAVQRGETPTRPGHCAMHDPRFSLRVSCRGSLDINPSSIEADLVFIDGDHSASMVKHDTRLARSIIRNNGIIIWHDYFNPKAEVTEVLDEYIRHGRAIEHIAGTWLAVERYS